jgi:hypothetical protein
MISGKKENKIPTKKNSATEDAKIKIKLLSVTHLKAI